VRALVISATSPNLGNRSLAEFVDDNAIDLVITAGDQTSQSHGCTRPVGAPYQAEIDDDLLQELAAADD
jgi:hypothetical protein